MDELIRAINRYPNGTILIIETGNGCSIKGSIDTIYETDNGIEPEESSYKEYYACVFKVFEISNISDSCIDVRMGCLIEISMENPPKKLSLEDGKVIWSIK